MAVAAVVSMAALAAVAAVAPVVEVRLKSDKNFHYTHAHNSISKYRIQGAGRIQDEIKGGIQGHIDSQDFRQRLRYSQAAEIFADD